MARDDIKLLDNDYFRIPLLRPSKKIKFKNISFKNISSRWNNFRLEHLKKRLVAKKENLVGMEFSSKQLTPGKNRELVEKKITRKTQAIAKLESKINFLENGEYHSEEFVDSRAIKLKSIMMENLVYNRDSLYHITEQAAEEIMQEQNFDSVIDAEKEKIGARVREILAEKEAAKMAAAAAGQEENQSQSVEPVDEQPISTTESENNIDGEIVEDEVATVVSNNEVAEAINSEMNKIKVSGNESSAAKVNRFINEDGTYRLRREDIDEDFRITRFDRSKLPIPISEAAPVNQKDELDIPPFNTTAERRRKPDVEAPRKALTEIVEPKFHSFPSIVPPTIREQFEKNTDEDNTTIERDMPIVTPERATIHSEVANKSKETEETEETRGYGDLGTLMARVNLLRAEQRKIKEMEEAATKKANSVDEAHRKMMRRLSEYADYLEADCNASFELMSEVEKDAVAKEAQINAMIEIMASAPTQIQETSQGRVK